MKKLIIITLFSVSAYSQQITKICDGVLENEVPQQSYFTDLDGTFDKFIGDWKWENGNQIVTFRLSKISHYFDSENHVYKDYMVGNYSYSIDGGQTYTVNTISPTTNPDREQNALYAPCSEPTKIEFTFYDVVLNKRGATAKFEFLGGSLTQLSMSLHNPHIKGLLEGSESYSPNFSIPSELILTKQ